jgi:hypothetical protein
LSLFQRHARIFPRSIPSIETCWITSSMAVPYSSSCLPLGLAGISTLLSMLAPMKVLRSVPSALAVTSEEAMRSRDGPLIRLLSASLEWPPAAAAAAAADAATRPPARPASEAVRTEMPRLRQSTRALSASGGSGSFPAAPIEGLRFRAGEGVDAGAARGDGCDTRGRWSDSRCASDGDSKAPASDGS